MTSVSSIFFEAPDQSQTRQFVSTAENHVTVTSLFRAPPPSPNGKVTELRSLGVGKEAQLGDTLEIPAVCKYGGVHINGTCHIKPPTTTVKPYSTLVFFISGWKFEK